VVVNERDEAGAQALGELKDRGINQAANALAQSTDHVVSFSGCSPRSWPSTSAA
jgi:hypothetical protein